MTGAGGVGEAMNGRYVFMDSDANGRPRYQLQNGQALMFFQAWVVSFFFRIVCFVYGKWINCCFVFSVLLPFFMGDPPISSVIPKRKKDTQLTSVNSCLGAFRRSGRSRPSAEMVALGSISISMQLNCHPQGSGPRGVSERLRNQLPVFSTKARTGLPCVSAKRHEGCLVVHPGKWEIQMYIVYCS